MSRAISTLDWRGTGAAASAIVFRHARVFDPRAGIDAAHDLVVRDGRVAELASAGSAGLDDAEVVDAEGLLAVPAFFDPHVHLRTPGREDKEDIETGSRAAAAGGYCGIIGMANTEPPVDTPAQVESLRERAQTDATVPVGFVATLTRAMRGNELTDMAELGDAGAVGFSDDGLPVRSARVMRRALQYQALAGLQIALHEEDPELSGTGVMHEGEAAAVLGMAGIPSVSESTIIARDCALADFEGARIHVQHLSARESVEIVEAAKALGVQVTCEATPHHLTLTDQAVRSLDSRFKMNPPLRSEDDRQALIAAVRSGVIDTIATDHAPHTLEDKEVPFEEAAMGVTGLETAFSVLYTDLVLSGILDLPTVIERLSAGAAAFDFDLPSLRPDAEANVALIDLDEEWEAGAEGWESRSENSCFAGRRLKGRSLMTIVAGQVAFRQRSFAMGVAP
ncbi:MAG: dihydroorotase [Actinomycetota bacterium]|nr:dihydroorotase [Actinomycetota bacterium]